MRSASEFLAVLDSIDLTAMTGDIIDSNTDAVAELNRKQLLRGENNEGMQLSPKYSEDPWFKKPGAAQRYADWKQKMFPETPYDVPNLIITGVFHNSIQVSVAGNNVNYNDSASFASAIAAKYDSTALGLNDKSHVDAWNEIVKQPLQQKVAELTGATIL